MNMTMTQKIMAKKVGVDYIKSGELVNIDLDLTLANDITAPVAINEFYNANFNSVFNKEKIALILDHFTPNKDIKSAQQCKLVREFAKKFNIKHFYEGGLVGIEHVLIPELGLVKPGDIIIGADSHTCTYGALNAFSTGVGSTDMAISMVTGKAWFKVPRAIKINLVGKLPSYVSGKDVILSLIGKIGVDGALYKSLEFVGEGVASLSMDDRFTICNMAIEAGAKNGIFISDEKTMEYLSMTNVTSFETFSPDDDGVYDNEIEIDLSKISPIVAFPHLPSNVKTALEAEANEIKIDQIIIGSCTNGRYSDLEIAAKILIGRKVCEKTRVIIIPATPKIYLEALRNGLIEIFINSGCIISPPTCGPCLGGHMGILADGEKALATTNRNFVGRMGHPNSEVYLSSPAVAAYSAIYGYIKNPSEV